MLCKHSSKDLVVYSTVAYSSILAFFCIDPPTQGITMRLITFLVSSRGLQGERSGPLAQGFSLRCNLHIVKKKQV